MVPRSRGGPSLLSPSVPAIPDSLLHFMDHRGLWRDLRDQQPISGSALRPALFLDRDGTIIEPMPYLSRPEEVRVIPEAATLIARANALTMPVVVVTNQSGIERGLFDWQTYAAVEDAVTAAMATAGGRIDAVYACPRMPATPLPFGRKPGPGMLTAAAEDLGLDLAKSWIAGDAASDIEAGRNAGLLGGWLLPTGYGVRDEAAARGLAREGFEVVVGEKVDGLGARLART
jgi:D-glycero-D-manno-heptose 1,7-bisphosphate phosphatase